MFRTLVESRPVRARSRSAAAFSLVAHLVLVGTAVAATATGEPDPTTPVSKPAPVIFVHPRNDPPREAPKPADPKPPTPAPAVPKPAPMPPLTPPTEIPRTIPPVDPNAAPTVEPNYGPGGQIFESTDPNGTGSGDPFAGIMWVDEVEVAAAPIGRQRQPRYPEILRASRVEGGVTVMFVVDSAGKVEPESFKVIESSHSLFEPAVKAAVLSQRFKPAKWHGQQVRQLVQQRFAFTLSR